MNDKLSRSCYWYAIPGNNETNVIDTDHRRPDHVQA